MGIFKILIDALRFMPPWVRNVTYLTFLLVAVYLALGPRLITGQVVAKTEDGGLVPYRGVDIQYQVAGHVLRFTTNEFGYWAIPVVDRLPNSIEIQILHKDEGAWFPIKIRYADIWFNDFRIVVADEAPLVRLETVDHRSWKSLGRKALAALGESWVHPAVAGIVLRQAPADANLAVSPPKEKASSPAAAPGKAVLPALPRVAPTSPGVASGPSPMPLVPGEAPDEMSGQILDSVREIVAEAMGTPVSGVDADFSFGAKSRLSYVRRIQVIENVENIYDLKIPDGHWQSFVTVGDLGEYVYDRKRLEEEFPAVKQSKNPHDWYEIQQKLPQHLKPVFVPTK